MKDSTLMCIPVGPTAPPFRSYKRRRHVRYKRMTCSRRSSSFVAISTVLPIVTTKSYLFLNVENVCHRACIT
jgi:hypothetical protein